MYILKGMCIRQASKLKRTYKAQIIYAVICFIPAEYKYFAFISDKDILVTKAIKY